MPIILPIRPYLQKNYIAILNYISKATKALREVSWGCCRSVNLRTAWKRASLLNLLKDKVSNPLYPLQYAYNHANNRYLIPTHLDRFIQIHVPYFFLRASILRCKKQINT